MYDGDFVCYFVDFVQFVCDEYDGCVFVVQLVYDGYQFVGFLWCQYCCWFVEYEYFGIVGECFDDFDVLLYVYWQVVDQGVRVDVEVELGGDCLYVFLCFCDVELVEGFGLFMFEYYVFCYGEYWDEYEVLVDYFDFCSYCVIGIVEVLYFVVEEDFFFIGLVEVVEDVYEGGFVCVVFVEQCVDFIGFDYQIDVVVGNEGVELFGDVVKFEFYICILFRRVIEENCCLFMVWGEWQFVYYLFCVGLEMIYGEFGDFILMLFEMICFCSVLSLFMRFLGSCDLKLLKLESLMFLFLSVFMQGFGLNLFLVVVMVVFFMVMLIVFMIEISVMLVMLGLVMVRLLLMLSISVFLLLLVIVVVVFWQMGLLIGRMMLMFWLSMFCVVCFVVLFVLKLLVKEFFWVVLFQLKICIEVDLFLLYFLMLSWQLFMNMVMDGICMLLKVLILLILFCVDYVVVVQLLRYVV